METTKDLHEKLVKAVEWASTQSHHPQCRVAKLKSNACECFVGACKKALSALREGANMEKLEHGEKIIDGIRLQYHCQPCPECEAKLEAAEEVATIFKYTHREFDPYHSVYYPNCQACAALSLWDNARKGEG